MSLNTKNKKRNNRGVLPHNELAEQSVLGGVLSDVLHLNEANKHLLEGDFYDPRHRLIYQAVQDIYKQNKPVDILTVSAMIESKGEIQNAGGADYIMSLPDMTPVISNVIHYIALVKKDALLRQLIYILDESTNDCFGEVENVEDVIGEIAKRLYSLSEEGQISELEEVGRILNRVIDEIYEQAKNGHQRDTIRTGFNNIDKALGGLRRGALIVIAARPGMGKTALALNIVQKAAIQYGVKSAVFSLEMNKEEIIKRMLSMQTKIDSKKLAHAKLKPEEWERLPGAIEPLYAAPIYIDDYSNTKVMEMLAKCRQLKMEEKLDLVVVDYLQLMSSDVTRREANRQQEISDISRALKIMARELNVPVIAISQLSRSSESRSASDRTPRLSDLRDSGAIEQDADAVLFIYREAYYENEMKTEQEDAKIIIAKNRQGETGQLDMGWWPKYTMFFEKMPANLPTEPPPF